ncbi:MAG: DNA mismatch repair protein MutS [Sphaerochaeta sp.]|jgi:DNA mismatch repair protein MutS
MSGTVKRTPMMEQYHQIKAGYPDSILFFRLGDFYEMFEEDAIVVSALLNLTLTKRHDIPMCGIPYHAAKSYIKRLLDAGKKIAICEQTQLPEGGRGLAKREVVQVITPATVVEDDFLQAGTASFILSAKILKDQIATSYADLSGAQFFLRTIERDRRYLFLASLIEEIHPSEILVNEDEYFADSLFKEIIDQSGAMVTKLPSWHYDVKGGFERLTKQIEATTLKGFGLEEDDPLLGSAGALVRYLEETAKTSLTHIDGYTLVDEEQYLRIDEASRKNLELFVNQWDGSARFSLYNAIDKCRTSAGSRKLKQWLASPLTDTERILERQRWVSLFVEEKAELNRVRTHLKEVLDLQRLVSRITMGRHMPKDLVGISQTIKAFFAIMESRYQPLLDPQIDQDALATLVELAQMIERAINDSWQGPFEEGRVILDGFDPDLDEKRALKAGGKSLLDAYLAKVKEETGIPTIKLSSNKIHGHFLEVSKAQAAKIGPTFYRKQTLVNAERFTSDELIGLEQKILLSAAQAESREREVYETVVEETAAMHRLLSSVSEFLSDLDVLASMGWCAIEHGYVAPTFTADDRLVIVGGRHAVVEQHIEVGQFVANDLAIQPNGERFALITGPNMAGKSTYLRQNALIVILAQIGSWVPAQEASLGIVDRLYCRVGSTDNLARGESTFLVEMQEAAHILNTATRNSLVIVDELGRGTSTQDGMAIAYAVMQSLIELGSKTLFATHYHELAQTDTIDVQLLTLEVSEQGGRIRFLRRVVEGIANSSYGLNVARMAGIKTPVLQSARRFQRQHFALYDLDNQQGDLFSAVGLDEEPLYATDPIEQEVIEQIRLFGIDHSTPMDALLLLKKLQEQLSRL